MKHDYVYLVLCLLSISGRIVCSSMESIDSSESSIADTNQIKWPVYGVSGSLSSVHVKKVAAYFLRKDLQKRKSVSSSDYKPVDQMKLHKLLYYAQGYFLAVYGKRLFWQNVVEYDHGPLVWDISNPLRGEVELLEKHMKLLTLNDNELDPSLKTHLDVIFEMNRSYTGIKLRHITHDEEPFEKTEYACAITDGVFREFFRNHSEWSEYIRTRLNLTPAQESNEEIITYIRECISFCFTQDEINRLHKSLTQSLIEKFEPKEVGRYVRWPHQETDREGLLSHLFFPVQFERLYECAAILCTREKLQNLLALSAHYGNPLAHVHMNEVLEQFDTKKDDDSENEHYLDRAAQQLIEQCAIEPIKGISVPHLLAGLLCTTQGKRVPAKKHFKIGFKQGDPWCGYRCALLMTNKKIQRQVADSLEKSNRGLAYMIRCRYDLFDSPSRVNRPYESAGRLGIPEGYNCAAVLAEHSDSLETALKLYCAAARNHILSAYDSAAKILIKQEKNDEALVLYREKATAGDLEGFAQAGELLLDLDKIDEAEKSFEDAGLKGYFYLERLENAPDSLVKKHRQAREKRFSELKETAGYEIV